MTERSLPCVGDTAQLLSEGPGPWHVTHVHDTPDWAEVTLEHGKDGRIVHVTHVKHLRTE